jgi:hypothetical protein
MLNNLLKKPHLVLTRAHNLCAIARAPWPQVLGEDWLPDLLHDYEAERQLERHMCAPEGRRRERSFVFSRALSQK